MKCRQPAVPIDKIEQERDRESQALLAILALSEKNIREGKTAPAAEVFTRIRAGERT